MSKTATTLENLQTATAKAIMSGDISNEDLVVFLNSTVQDFLNPVIPSDYAKSKGISPQAAAKDKRVRVIFGRKFICDND